MGSIETVEGIMAEFRRPFFPKEVHYKIGVVGQQAVMCLAYVDARNVSERLNRLVPGNWSTDFTPIELAGVPGVECTLSINLENLGFYAHRADIGSFDNVREDAFGLKAVYSDAFKRAAVHFGIGVSLYAHPSSFIRKDKKSDLRFKGEKPVGITSEGEAKLRATYDEWLEEEGISTFGEPL